MSLRFSEMQVDKAASALDTATAKGVAYRLEMLLDELQIGIYAPMTLSSRRRTLPLKIARRRLILGSFSWMNQLR